MAGSDSEWRQVRRRRKKACDIRTCQLSPKDFGGTVDMSRIQERVREAMMELTCQDFWQDWKEMLTGCLSLQSQDITESGPDPHGLDLDCVCYGLGSFLSGVTSRYQLAMLLLLLEALKIPHGRCSMFDPVFSPAECKVLRTMGFTVLSENEEGKRPVSRPTLFYLLHCGTALYNNLLWSNWSQQKLPLLTIMGNSFQGLQDRMVQQDLKREYSFIANVCTVCEETSLPCSARFSDVFNDTVLLQFPRQRLSTLPLHVWTHAPEPKYLNCKDLEIILREVSS
ncbi:SRR1-like protein [Brienomyrus brachyistius]|uniref:SRR1-like protein n=1 Tax=Brienomyrus brachyistius TaxID=42636 RepID=UPI0020B3A75C|nr:SRR1-like protein [Brienomyrus brachyistius]XP_048834484.1 SRR1-like protein [Brienomyrus brachyistius]